MNAIQDVYQSSLRASAKAWLAFLAIFLLSGLAQAQVSPDTADPAGLEFDIAMSYTPAGDLLLFYSLSNVGDAPFKVKPVDLKIYYGVQEAPYDFTHSPAPGLANQLSQGESEFGSITVVNPPLDSDNLQLVWPLVELSSDTKHILLRRFGDIVMNVQDEP